MYRPLALFFLLIYSIIIIIVIIIRSYVYRWPKMMIEKLPVMGYSIATDMDGTSYRYTQWVGYNYSTAVVRHAWIGATNTERNCTT